MKKSKHTKISSFLPPLIACAGGALSLGLLPSVGPVAWLGLAGGGVIALFVGEWMAQASSGQNDLDFAEHVFEDAVDPKVIVSHNGLITRVNHAATLLFALKQESLLNTVFASFFVDQEAAMSTLDKVHARGSARDISLSLKSMGGLAREVSLTATVLALETQGPRAVLVVLRDVSEAHHNELASLKRFKDARTLIEASIDPLFATAIDGRLIDANMAVVHKTGISQEQLHGTRFADLFTDPTLAQQYHERALSDGKVTDAVLVLKHRNGSQAHITFNASLIRDEDGSIIGVFGTMRDITATRKAEQERDEKDWVVNGIARLNSIFQEEGATKEFTHRIISEVTEYTESQVGAFYVQESEGESRALTLIASHAYIRRKSMATRFLPGEGIIGQAALERKQILISDIPEDYIRISSGLGEASPRHLCVTPLLFEGSVKGMIEVASFARLSNKALDYLRQATQIITVALEASVARERVATALSRAQQLAAELEAQQETLRNTNAELEEQTAALKLSEHKLKAQQAEIELANSELQQKNELLERQRNETEEARKTLAIQAEEVTLASKYKSEFLANMSHELRTPLNSLLLLARSLRENADKNLTPDQVESAGVIFESGSDLLNLINEILDLSKIEAGKMELRLDDVDLADVARSLVLQFDPMAKAQGLTLDVVVDASAPVSIVSDAQRLGQVLKNLIGNAIKFTEKGSVSVTFARATSNSKLSRSGLSPAKTLAIHVKDTGIGIALDKQKVIFEAFQQADSGDRRRFGGTGLGLSISRELAHLLGGEIQVVSALGQGSTFTIFLPDTLGVPHPKPVPVRATTTHFGSKAPAPAPAPAPLPTPAPVPAPRAPSLVPDDRATLQEDDRVVLLIEDDVRFAKVLIDHIRQRGFKCVYATTGEEGLELALEHRPHGVILDIGLPGMDGWAVLTALKQNVSLRHIPVHIVSAEPVTSLNLGIGAVGHAAKPISREQIDDVLKRLDSASAHAAKRVLVIEDDPLMRKETARVIGNGNVKVHAVGTAHEGLDALRSGAYELVVMDLGLPDMQGVDMLKQIADEKLKMPPVIIHTVRELTMEEELFLRNYSDSIIIKDVRSQERLIDEVALFLHRVVRELPEDKRRAILHVRESNEPLRGKKILIVEDDMRTMFAMARMLAGHGVNPLKAENGERALEILKAHPDTDLVLLDMMMPVMDGYETARRLRASTQFARLPIIALTAKAMREDRQKCLDAGCTDYLSKPVDPERLASLMRVLLFR